MQPTDHFVWEADPIAFELGPFEMPFPISILGIVAGIVLIYFGLQKIMPEDQPRDEKLDVPAWKFWGVIIGSLVLGQIVFLVLPSPTIETIGPIRPHWYGILFASAFVAGFFITRRMFQDAGRKPEEVEQLVTYVIIATIIGARLGHVLFYDFAYFSQHPLEIFLPFRFDPEFEFTGFRGLASHGAAAGILIAMYLFAKRKRKMSFLWLADRVVVAVAIGGAFIRTGNFFNSEIVGQPADLPWAVVFTRIDMLPRHPTMLYEALLCLAVLGVLWMVYRKYHTDPPEGSLFGIFLTLLFGGRFLLEFTKIPQAEFASNWLFNMGQWLSLPLVAAGVWLIWKKVRWGKKPEGEH